MFLTEESVRRTELTLTPFEGVCSAFWSLPLGSRCAFRLHGVRHSILRRHVLGHFGRWPGGVQFQCRLLELGD